MNTALNGSDDPFDLPPLPPYRLFERLRQIPGHSWDESRPPFHSTYDFWHVAGTRYILNETSTAPSPHNASSPGSVNAKGQTGRPPSTDPHGLFVHDDGRTTPGATQQASIASQLADMAYTEQPVIARVSYHPVREERAFHIAKSLIHSLDPEADHIVEPLDIFRLTPVPGDRMAIIVAIYVDIGPNFLWDKLDMGPAFYKARVTESLGFEVVRNSDFLSKPQITLEQFLDFSIGVAQCLELLHHGKGMIHGEIRGDAFHYNLEENKVKIISFGSGVRSFENGLTSTGWSSLSKELGAKNKLLYISPEQTGRMPAEPDSRTDIYSVGVLFWTLLTQQPVYEGDSPLDIVQGVLGKRIPNVSTVRLDIPDVIGRIIQKCTAKNVADRYHSASGLRHDLNEVQRYLGDGNMEALKDYAIGTKDISSFFMLPNVMIGREREKAELLRVIDRAAKRYQLNEQSQNTGGFSDGSVLSGEARAVDDGSSEAGTSSHDGANRRSGSFTFTISSDHKQPRNSFHPSIISETQLSNETMSSGQSAPLPRGARPWDRHQSISIDGRSLLESGSGDQRNNVPESNPSNSLSRQLGTAKFRRKGQCELVLIEGAGGLGKSFLVNNVVSEARRRGYCATAKFDTARRTAFGPLLKLLSSLFRQVWGERNTETPFHQGLKQYIRPVWPMIHRVLGLPEFLLGPADVGLNRSISTSQASPSRPLVRPGMKRRGSSPGLSPARTAKNSSVSSSASQDFLRAGSSTKSMRLMNIFLDILRVFTSHKFICFCLDDLHFADDESLELISQMLNSKMNMVVIITYRPEEMSSHKLQSVIEPPELDDSPRGTGPRVSRLPITPLSEDEIADYVSTTMCRPRNEIISLALVIQSKSGGNPFYMREMLSAAYRKRCIWYDYRDSRWHFDLDKIFVQFQDEQTYDVLGTSFITHRLDELPEASRSLLAWAALLGNSFSFDFICQLMGGEFDSAKDVEDENEIKLRHKGYTNGQCIDGLQAAVQAYIIVQSESDDIFRFAHDRYIHAAADLKECHSTQRMHFMIAQTLMKYYSGESHERESTAMHVCEAVSMIKRRVKLRAPYRQLLIDCARAATEGSARPTAAKYYIIALELLQEDAWEDGKEDVSYNETLQLYLRSAECQAFIGHHHAATQTLTTVFAHAKSAIDKAPAYVLQSRIYAANGEAAAALTCLKESLSALGVLLDENPTYEKCDQKFEEVTAQIRSIDPSMLAQTPPTADPTLASIGAVLSETIAASWWSDCLRYYHLSLVMVEMHLSRGAFPQSGLAFLNLATISLSRFNMAKFAVELGNTSQDLLYQGQDSFSLARGLTLYPILIGHSHQPMAASLSQMEHAIEYAALAGDRTSIILSYGMSALVKFFASENVVDLESFCQYSCEEVPNWYFDTRGGSLLLAVRQLSRALQGKTNFKDPNEVMSDGQHHNGPSYKSWLASKTYQSNRSSLLYESLEIIPLFLYNHYDRAVQLGKNCLEHLPMFWSSRNSRLVLLFYGLALTGRLLRKMHDPALSRIVLRLSVNTCWKNYEPA